MRFVYHFYVLIIILRDVSVVQNAADFDVEELKHLSRKLNPIECMRLLEAMYLETAAEENCKPKVSRDVGQWGSKATCLVKLKEWSHKFPDHEDPDARVSMELNLKSLGRPDLAKYIRRNRKVVEFLNSIVQDTNEMTEGNNTKGSGDHRISKRELLKNKMIKRGKKSKKNRGRSTMGHQIQDGLSNHKLNPVAVVDEAASSSDANKLLPAFNNNSLAFFIVLGIIIIAICGVVLYFICKQLLIKYSKCSNKKSPEKTSAGCTDCCTKRSKDFEIDVENEARKSEAGDEDKKNGTGDEPSIRKNCKHSQEEIETRDEETLANRESKKKIAQVSSRCATICKPEKKKRRMKDQLSPKRLKAALDKQCKEKLHPTKYFDKEQMKKKCRTAFEKSRLKCEKNENGFDFKELQAKILAILRKDYGNCRCCKCAFANEGNGKSKKFKFLCKDVCQDLRCTTTICPSPLLQTTCADMKPCDESDEDEPETIGTDGMKLQMMTCPMEPNEATKLKCFCSQSCPKEAEATSCSKKTCEQRKTPKMKPREQVCWTPKQKRFF